MDTSNEQKTTTPAGSGPGKALRKARTDLHLSPEDAAAQLHLAPRQIIALESDDYENLPQSTYVRGYLRNYALLLGLSPEPILESYARMTAGHKPPRLVQGDPDQHATQHDTVTKWISAGVAALVLALGYAWWQGRESETALEPTTATAPAPVVQGDLAPGVPAAPSGQPAIAPQAAVSAPETKPQVPAPVVPPAAARKIEPASPAQAPGAPAAALRPEIKPQVPAPVVPPAAARKIEPTQPAQAPGAPAAAPKPAPAEADKPASAAVRASAQEPAADEKRARLVLQVDVESWAEVRDARETRLIYETIPAGRIVGLEGVPPFQVFLGNIEGVKVFYEGQPFDAARYQRGTTARFSVGTGQPGNQ